MIRTRIFAAAMVMTAFASCGNNGPERPAPKPAERNPWALHNDLVEKVEVYDGQTLVQSFRYQYDEKNCLLSQIERVDEISKSPVYKLSFTYDGGGKAVLKGTFLYKTVSLEASFNEDRDVLEYASGNSESSLTLDSDNLPALCMTNSSWKGLRYSSKSCLKTGFVTRNSDIVTLTLKTGIESETDANTASISNAGVEYDYTYSDDADLQNFAVFLIPCDHAVWTAAELPGCAHLITGMTCRRGSVTMPESFTVSYVLNDNGSIRSATRTDFSRGVEVSSLRYEFTYL